MSRVCHVSVLTIAAVPEEFLTPENFKDVRVVVNRDALDVMLNARPLYMAEGLKAPVCLARCVPAIQVKVLEVAS